jgi:hypothetical protein
MRQSKQNFTLRVIKMVKKEVITELFPKDADLAFLPNNCLSKDSENGFDDNLFRYKGEAPSQVRGKAGDSGFIPTQTFVIFGTRMMIHQLKLGKQWYIPLAWTRIFPLKNQKKSGKIRETIGLSRNISVALHEYRETLKFDYSASRF